ncbi:hypothetical protein Xen7305DRAFT_00029250 [Xenococcus sp. PCC 7305]|uniref:hypothetical protein n=1 Tax=Xenococcus sp. PCC 7305 TaxID=102125 RepID=UPI0002AC3730|nr:hypothetical protein [Xenococcus sp. PCC 7305]ELS03205.1 hypothetical protein Xen7305DRAFT_00029250 [Xenococcus sp. PCC 7305]
MSYSNFSLKDVKSQLGISLIENDNLFSAVEDVEISQILREILSENIPLARAINTEKARSELIIANVLVEVRKIFHHSISLFSGIEFNVDKENNLNGFCDFILSASPEQLMLNAPIVTIVEAKNENIIGGLGQCIAEMVAADIFNKSENNNIGEVYGVVTTGTAWKFLKLAEKKAYIDLNEYYIDAPGKIIGILSKMIEQKI